MEESTELNILCSECKKIIKSRRHLKCSICNGHYDLFCANVSSKTYYSITSKSKTQWKCSRCLDDKSTDAAISRNSNRNILKATSSPVNNNQRQKPMPRKSLSAENLFTLSETHENNLSGTTLRDDNFGSPLSTTSLNDSFQEQDLKKSVHYLTEELTLAQDSIKKLKSDNVTLRKTIEEMENKIKNLYEIVQKGNPIVKKCLLLQDRDSINVPPDTFRNNAKDMEIQECPIRKQNTENNSIIINPENNLISDRDNMEITKGTNKRKIIILADQQGKGTQHYLQQLLGNEFEVTCFWKSGARLDEVLNTMNREILKLTKRDFVIIIGGTNDMSPFKVEENLILFFNFAKNTNIIVSEIPFNSALHEHKLNHNIKLLCNNYGHISFVDMDYSRFIPRGKKFTISLCRYLLKDILCIDYKYKMENFVEMTKQFKEKKITTRKTNFIDKASQTESEYLGNNTGILITDYGNDKSFNDLFRS